MQIRIPKYTLCLLIPAVIFAACLSRNRSQVDSSIDSLKVRNQDPARSQASVIQDTLHISLVSSDSDPNFSEFPFGKTSEFKQISKNFPHLSVTSRVIHWQSGDKALTYQLSTQGSFVKFYKDISGSDEDSPYFEIYYGKIVDSTFALPGGVQIGMTKEDLLSKLISNPTQQLLAEVHVVDIQVDPYGPNRIFTFQNRRLKSIYFKQPVNESNDSIKY